MPGGRRGRVLAVAMFALALLLGGCRVFQLGEPLREAPGDWRTEGGSAMRANATATTLTPPLEAVWSADVEGAFGPAAALVADGVVVVVTRKGEIRGLDLEDGRKRSVGDLREPIEGAPVLGRKTIYVPVSAGKRTIVAHDFVKGVRTWSLRAGPHQAGLLLADATLVAAGQDGTVRAIDVADGTVRWTVTPDSAAGYVATPAALGPAALGPAANGGAAIVVADDLGGVRALDLTTGAVRWSRDLGRPVYESPAVAAGTVYLPTTRGVFAALDVRSGEPRWRFDVGDDEVRFSGPAVAHGLVVVGASDGRLRALDAETGEEVWNLRSDGNFSAAPLIAGDVVYAGTLGNVLYALDLASGDVLWEHTLDGRIKTSPVLYGDRLVVLAEPRHVHVFQPASPLAATPRD